MEALEKQYKDALTAIKDAVQDSEILAAYLEEEEDAYYVQLQEYFEPAMQQLFDQVALERPLQLVALEKEMLDPALEGLFLPKILGYSVLRGEIDEKYRYRRPQDHFKHILEAICQSANFEMIKKRIGQTIQVGFALSSDIWITNIIESQTNKRVKSFLQSLRLDKFREVHNRKDLYEKYSMQLKNVNFASTKFPTTEIELKSSFHSLRSFLHYRANDELDNSALMKEVSAFINNEAFHERIEFFELMIIIGLHYDLDKKTADEYRSVIAKLIKMHHNFDEAFYSLYEKIHEDKEITIWPENEQRISKLVSGNGSAEIDKFFKVADEVHTKGFVHPDAIESVSKYYEAHKGMSLQNECLRASILLYIRKFVQNLTPEHYADYMEINKVVIAYINIFDNEKFNQEVKDAGMEFVRKCIKHFTDKKSRDYQDIKKYVSATFVELGFLSPKEVVDLFKTKRKPKSAS